MKQWHTEKGKETYPRNILQNNGKIKKNAKTGEKDKQRKYKTPLRNYTKIFKSVYNKRQKGTE